MEVTRAADEQEAVELFEKSAPGCFGVIYMDIHLTKPLDEQDDQRFKAVHRRTECRKAAERFVTLCSGQPNKNNRNIAMYSSVEKPPSARERTLR